MMTKIDSLECLQDQYQSTMWQMNITTAKKKKSVAASFFC